MSYYFNSNEIWLSHGTLSFSVNEMVSIKTDLCETNYCQDGIYVNFPDNKLHGHYEIQTIYVNNKPYFKMETQGIWWSNGFWLIGKDSNKGQTKSSAYYKADDYCPHQLKKPIWTVLTDQWILEQYFYITCKYINYLTVNTL